MGSFRNIGGLLAGAVLGLSLALPAGAAEDTLPDSMERPNGFPERPLNMIVPYGPGGGSGQVSPRPWRPSASRTLTGQDITPRLQTWRLRHGRSGQDLHGGPGGRLQRCSSISMTRPAPIAIGKPATIHPANGSDARW